MLTIEVPEQEVYDEKTNRIITVKAKTLQFEHSLISISKWEAKWKRPFLSKEKMTVDQFIDYISFMCLTPNVDKETILCIGKDGFNSISNYINDPMTATWFSNDKIKNGRVRETITSELVYYWMIALNIPMECQKWHFNRLMTLIKICNIKNAPSKKMKRSEIMARNKALNDARRARLHTSG